MLLRCCGYGSLSWDFAPQYEDKQQRDRQSQNRRHQPKIEHKPLHEARRLRLGALGLEVTSGVRVLPHLLRTVREDGVEP